MSWADQRKQGYVLVASTSGCINYNSLDVKSFIMHKSNSRFLKKLIDKFLKEIDDTNLVIIDIQEEANGEVIFGSRRPHCFFIDISVFNEDLKDIDTEKPIRILVKTDVFPNNKDYFVKFFENFSKVCGW